MGIHMANEKPKNFISNGKIRCGAKTRRGTRCRMKALANGRCKHHGGLSSGPKSIEGRKRIADGQKRRWARWRETSEGAPQ